MTGNGFSTVLSCIGGTDLSLTGGELDAVVPPPRSTSGGMLTEVRTGRTMVGLSNGLLVSCCCWLIWILDTDVGGVENSGVLGGSTASGL